MLALKNLSLMAVVVFSTISMPLFAADRLVNMIPNGRSGETNQDSEPTITVDPVNPLHMAGSAFTWDNLNMSPMVTSTAPIYVTLDGGTTWTLAYIVPSRMGSGFPTGDITLSFSSTPSGATAHQTSWLYGGTLSATSFSFPMTVLRGQDPFSNTAVMSVLDTHSGNVDQPHTLARTTPVGKDKLYIGFNNGYNCVVPGGRTSTLDVSQDATVTTPVLGLDLIEQRNTSCQDGFAQVPAANKDGTVYAAFLHDWTGALRLVVVRDDNWGTGSPPFSALTDPSDSAPGRFVTNTITRPFGIMGQNRLGGSNVSLAVDPANSKRVYVAWGDANGANSETIHVRNSIDSGASWSGDLLTLNNALNPEVAINDLGVVGVLYQTVVSGRWETHLVHSINLAGTVFSDPGTVLASQDASAPLSTIASAVYVGDYASLTASGNDFIGMFSTSNYPDKANFMSGVQYQREVDWNTHKLYADAAHTQEVQTSIDPFFFEIGTTICDLDRFFCDICRRDPRVCYPIYDPWWWLKCPMCGVTIYLNPGDEYTRINVYDSERKNIGEFHQLSRPVTIKGVRYTYAITVQARQGVGYVLQARVAPGKSIKSFRPQYFAKVMQERIRR